jgi:hypothetical protein
MADETRDQTPWEKFVDATRRILSVPKADVEKAMRDARRKRRRKLRQKPV